MKTALIVCAFLICGTLVTLFNNDGKLFNQVLGVFLIFNAIGYLWGTSYWKEKPDSKKSDEI